MMVDTPPPTIKDMMVSTLAQYGNASRQQGRAMELGEVRDRRRWAKESARQLLVMHHLIGLIKEAPNLGEDITADTPEDIPEDTHEEA